MSAEETRFVRRTLGLWSLSLEMLEQPRDRAFPWVVLFDEQCTFHLNSEPGVLADLRPLPGSLSFHGKRISVSAIEHKGNVHLPDGVRFAPHIMGMTALYHHDSKPYFVAALPRVWRATAAARTLDAERFPLGVLAHEMVHTLDLVDIHQRIEALRRRFAAMPKSVTDDTIEEVFGKQPSYRQAYERERDLLRKAVAERDARRSRTLVAQALQAMESRRAHFFRGRLAFYSELDELFLLMEGSAVWTHARLARARPDLVEFSDKGNAAWSQEEGYLLFQLFDRFIMRWPKRVLARPPAMPAELLREIVR